MSNLQPIPDVDYCAECGAATCGLRRPWGGHYPFCGFFSSQQYRDDMTAEQAQTGTDSAEASDDDLPY